MTHDLPQMGSPRSRQAASTDRARRRRRSIWLIELSLVLLLLAAGGAGYWLYRHLNDNIKGVDLEQVIRDGRPMRLPDSGQNLLVLGSDSRSGANASLATGKVAGAQSDTAMVIHISQGGSKAVAVSIPRDTLVTRPTCTAKDGTAIPSAQRVMFNSVYSLAGPVCVVRTVEHMSGVRIDHFLEIDFAGFKELVNAIGGVTVTVDQNIHDKFSGLDLSAGTHRLDGIQALQFVRTRHGIGDGSDLGRIGLQQQFLIALLSEVKKQHLLSSPTKAYRIANQVTASLTTDSGLASLAKLVEFGRDMSGIDTSALETIMLPVQYDLKDPNRVVATQPQAGRLWQALRRDQKIPEAAKKPPTTGSLNPEA
ncbi:LCP family protein [Streptomyces sp. NPDC093982]|uniref:LCP family protein n=1 Tax=Streptomyces sp. NPDC093982 TaxID=3155077 RepID=UPI003440C973